MINARGHSSGWLPHGIGDALSNKSSRLVAANPELEPDHVPLEVV